MLWSTLGKEERMRVPLPAARITTESDMINPFIEHF